MDLKYDVLKHPNVDLSADGKAKPYIHGEITQAIASVQLDFNDIKRLEDDVENEHNSILDEYDLVSSEDIERYIKKEGILWKI